MMLLAASVYQGLLEQAAQQELNYGKGFRTLTAECVRHLLV